MRLFARDMGIFWVLMHGQCIGYQIWGTFRSCVCTEPTHETFMLGILWGLRHDARLTIVARHTFRVACMDSSRGILFLVMGLLRDYPLLSQFLSAKKETDTGDRYCCSICCNTICVFAFNPIITEHCRGSRRDGGVVYYSICRAYILLPGKWIVTGHL